MKILSERHNLPWAVMGDFNDVVIRDEKMDAMGSVEGGCLNIPIVWINATYFI